MAGRISEYLTLSKVLGTELVDVSAVDAGSPTGYTTLKTTVQDLADFNPSIYSASGDLAGNRTVNQDGNNLFFNDGDFGLDFGNQGFFYEDLTRRIGIGTQSPSSSLHIKGQSGDDLLKIEDSTSTLLHEFQDDGRVFLCKNGKLFQTGSSTNYLRHEVQKTTQFSSTATYTGFHANRNGSGIVLRSGSTNQQFVNSTGSMGISTGWNNSFNSGVTKQQIWLDQSTGFVGVNALNNTIVPDAQLHVYGQSSQNILILEDSLGDEKLKIDSNGVVSMGGLPTSNTGLSAGDLYMATAADILSNGDLVMGVKQ